MSIFSNKMKREAETIKAMVGIYCKDHHTKKVENCEECLEIQKYALDRLFYCPFQEDKPSCKNCPIHCYKPTMKEDVKKVMRYAGPRMLMRHPVLTIYHLIDSKREPTSRAERIDQKAASDKDKKVAESLEPCEHLEQMK